MLTVFSRLSKLVLRPVSPAKQRRRLLVAWLLLTLSSTALTWWSIEEDRFDLEQRTATDLKAINRALAEQVDHVLMDASRSLIAIKSQPELQQALLTNDAAAIRSGLEQSVLRHRLFESLQVMKLNGEGGVGSDGQVNRLDPVEISRLLLSGNKDHFQFGPTRDANGMAFPHIPILSPIDNPQVEGARVLVGFLPTRTFNAFYDSLSMPRGTLITVYQDDGRLLLRYPDVLIPNAMTRDQYVNISLSYAKSGEAPFWVTSPFDGQRRLLSICATASLGMVVAVGKPEQAVFAGWKEESVFKGGICLLLVVAVGLAFLRVYHQLYLLDQQRVSIRLARLTIDQSADMVLVLDHEGAVLYRNSLARARLGTVEEWRQLELPDADLDWGTLQQQLDAQGRVYFPARVQGLDGGLLAVQIAAARMEYDHRRYVSLVLHDVTEQQAGEARIRHREEQLRMALAASDSGLYDIHLDSGEIVLDEHLQLLFKPIARQPGTSAWDLWLQMVHPDDRALASRTFQSYLEGQSHLYINEYRQLMANGEYRWILARGRFVEFDEMGRPLRIMGTLTDIHERKLAEAKIHELANYDPLTGLVNRNAVRLRLLDYLAARLPDSRVAMMFVNVDRFKTLNDSLGHQQGDRILIELATRLRQFETEQRILSRLGGDEFGLVWLGAPDEAGCETLAAQVLEVLAKPLSLDGHEINMTASLGLSYLPGDARTVEDLLRHADSAMHHAKDSGRNRWCTYQQEMGVRANERLMLETALRRALERNELELYYQPQFRILDGVLVGFEALLRWRHAELGMVSPAKFIPVAEASGLIVPLGEWVLREACRQNKAWQMAGYDPIVVAVNLSAPQFNQDDLLIRVREALVMSDLEPQWLELEVTESVVMNNVSRVIETLDALKQMGLQLAIDDFGTGYSSLAYLKQFAVDKLKIDRAFVNDLASNPNDAAIIEAIVALGQTMGMLVIAEGVETPEQLARLRSVGCNEVQGFLTGKPMPAPDVAAILSRGRWPQG